MPELMLDVTRKTFTLDARPVFLVGMSYHGALGAPEEFVAEDLRDLAALGFNWIRVWATWAAFDNDVSAVDCDGDERPPHWQRLIELCRQADERGMVVEVTLSRGNGVVGADLLATDDAHLNAVGVLAGGLRDCRNVLFDLANERNLADARHVEVPLLRRLRDAVKQVDPARLVTAGHAGDIDGQTLYEYLAKGKLDVIAPHRPRNADSPGQTAQRTRGLLARMDRAGRTVPVLFQEPFRRDFNDFQPTPPDYLADLLAAREAGAAGWCFHNGAARSREDGRPRRSFDLRPSEGRLLDQLDDTERIALDHIAKTLRGEPL